MSHFRTMLPDGTMWCDHRSLADAREFARTQKGRQDIEILIAGWPSMYEFYTDGFKTGQAYGAGVELEEACETCNGVGVVGRCEDLCGDCCGMGIKS